LKITTKDAATPRSGSNQTGAIGFTPVCELLKIILIQSEAGYKPASAEGRLNHFFYSMYEL